MITHGKPGTYSAGCRCDDCREANRLRMARVREYLKQKPFDQIPHGTPNGYSNYCCRCDECRAVGSRRNLEGRKSREARMAAGLAPEVPHGRLSTYSGWGCRCDECHQAMLRREKARREARKAEAWATSRPIQI